MTPLITNWRKSARSGNTANCVEVGTTASVVGVRDSKDPNGGTLMFTPAEWTGFVTAVKKGAFHLS